MLPNNKGFFLLDLLLSLSALLMICLFFIPLLMDIRRQSTQLEADTKARQLVYEELQASLYSTQAAVNYTVIQNGVLYHIFWRDSEYPGKKEVCIKIEKNTFLSATEICGVQE